MTEALNLHGDTLVATTGRHGADIASQRLDELDRSALQDALQASHAQRVGVELGCGLGTQGLRLALLGVRMHLYDLLPAPPPLVAAARHAGAVDLQFHSVDLRAPANVPWPPSFDLLISQRFLHYLRYDEALALLAAAAARMAPGGRLYVSASGLESPLGAGYGHAGLPPAQRHAPLQADIATAHGILEPVCLYREGELNALMRAAGCAVVSSWCSEFGNVKGVYEIPPGR